MLSSLNIKEQAISIGFDACGIAQATELAKEMKYYKEWLHKGYNAGMSYMHNYPNIRQDPKLLIEGAKTVIITLSNYYPSVLQDPEVPQIAKYAYGRDYHKVLLKKHRLLLSAIQKMHACNGRIFVDSAPVLERSWAVKAGLGWIGKSSMLISPTIGVHTLISGIVIDVDIDTYDHPMDRDCGKCTQCIDTCPTGAIVEPRIVDARKCISYLSIEHRGPFHDNTKLHNSIFGCDKCIDICPFNKRLSHQENDFSPKEDFLTMDYDSWNSMNEEAFNSTFNGTAVKRTKYVGIKRNLKHL